MGPRSARSDEGAVAIDRKARTRELLLDAAETAYARKGINATTMEDIARLAGVTRMTLYRHLPSRDELVAEVMHRAWQRVAPGLEATVDAGGDPAACLTELISGYVAAVDRHPYLLALAREQAPAGWGLVDEQGFVSRSFGPLVRRCLAADAVALRGEVDDTVAWLLRQVLLLLSLPKGAGLDARQQEVRRQIETFVVPAVLREPTLA